MGEDVESALVDGKGVRAKGSTLNKLLLAGGTLVVLVLLAELAVRLAFPYPAPVRYRDGVYINTLPLVNGTVMDKSEFPATRVPLEKRKADDELRVFVFGESSAVGGPWGYSCASATILHDMLARAFPDRKITVVNMGRSGSYTMDAYYYLLSIEDYGPDFVIFYNGNNDRYDAGKEMCMPDSHAMLHFVWRKLVASSRIFWNARVLGPRQLVGAVRTVGAAHGPEQIPCDQNVAFAGWTDILVRSAKRMKANVIVTIPVSNSLAEVNLHESSSFPFVDKALFECRLTFGCDFAKALVGYLESHRHMKQYSEAGEGLSARRAAWRSSAARYGAQIADLEGALRELPPEGLILPPVIFDEVHLSPEGYWLLASMWFGIIRADLRNIPVPEDTLQRALEPDPHFDSFMRANRQVHEERLVFEGMRYLEMNKALLALTMLDRAVQLYGNERARVAIGWMSLKVGLPSELPPELEDRARTFNVRDNVGSAPPRR